MDSQTFERRLIKAGVLLIFLGFLTGFLVGGGALANPRLGLSSHLAAIMGGTLLIVLGLIWQRAVHLSRSLECIAFWGLLYGIYANWFTTLLGAFLNANKATPLVADGPVKDIPWSAKEVIVQGFTISLIIVAAVSMAIITYGVLRSKPQEKQ